MKTALELPDEALDDGERHFLNTIKEHGWFSTRVFDHKGTQPDFTYSTGFSASFDFPEIIVFGLSKDTAHSVLWDVWRDIETNKKPPIGLKTIGIFGNADAVFLPVAKSAYPEHLGWSRWFYRGDNFDCLQLVWPDREGKFPWEQGFDNDLVTSQTDLTGGGWKSHPA